MIDDFERTGMPALEPPQAVIGESAEARSEAAKAELITKVATTIEAPRNVTEEQVQEAVNENQTGGDSQIVKPAETRVMAADHDIKDDVTKEPGAGDPKESRSMFDEAFTFSDPCLTIEEDNCSYPEYCPLSACFKRFLEPLMQAIDTLNLDIASLEHEFGKEIRKAIERHERSFPEEG
ncbi:MAG: hypothetical protein ABSD38_29030 [Syntrophorhabdales bacterium]|jgi:hypothetical protein